MKAFQYLLRRFGLSKTDIKEVTYAQRLTYVVWAGEQLAALRHDAGQKDAPFSATAVPNAGYGGSLYTGAGMEAPPAEMRRVVGKSDYMVLDLGCSKLALTALKLHDRGRLSDTGLRVATAVVRRVRQLMPHPSLYWFDLPTPLPLFHLSHVKEKTSQRECGQNKIKNQALKLLLDWGPLDIDSLAGNAQDGNFPLEIDLVAVDRRFVSGTCLTDMLAALESLLAECKQIRARFESIGEVANAKYHVVSLLHNTFASGK